MRGNWTASPLVKCKQKEMYFLQVIVFLPKMLKLLKAGSEESLMILREARGSVEKHLHPQSFIFNVFTHFDSLIKPKISPMTAAWC